MKWQVIILASAAGVSTIPSRAEPADVPERLQRWLVPQQWKRDTDGPIISLGPAGAFDDTHIFAPCVIHEQDQFRMWYCGSQNSVLQRVFRLGLASSHDGVTCTRHSANPVYDYGDGKHPVLTPTVLRHADGSVLREEGRLRMWFTAAHFAGTRLHTLQETISRGGIEWTPPSTAPLTDKFIDELLQFTWLTKRSTMNMVTGCCPKFFRVQR